MPITREEPQTVSLVTAREPVAVKTPGGPGTVGDQAFKDATLILIGCAAFLVLIYGSLHKHNA